MFEMYVSFDKVILLKPTFYNRMVLSLTFDLLNKKHSLGNNF